MILSLITKGLTTLDYAYFDSINGPTGDSLIVDASLYGSQDSDGFIFDFSYAKKTIKKIIDKEIDHKFVVNEKYVTRNEDDTVTFCYEDYYYKGPKEAFCILKDKINRKTIEQFIEAIVLKSMPDNIKRIEINLSQEVSSEAFYFFRYTHGLKNHYGNCQRLFHGHRSAIMVWNNNERDSSLEKYLITTILRNNVHFVFRDNIVNKDKLEIKNGRVTNSNEIILKYCSSQGEFEAHLPSRMCYILDFETSIENLSFHFLHILQLHNKSLSKIKLYLCEGVNKGAVCST